MEDRASILAVSEPTFIKTHTPPFRLLSWLQTPEVLYLCIVDPCSLECQMIVTMSWNECA